MTVFLVDLEAVPTRYTGEWKDHVPDLLKHAGLDVYVIDGPTDIPAATTPGAFLNFGGTNVYKAAQVEKISRLFCNSAVKDGDYFLFSDAWHPGIINLRYMAELLNVRIRIGALWHAGSYDPQDFLGRLIGDAPWVRHAEKSFFYAVDNNFFATQFHIEMFMKNLFDRVIIPGDPEFVTKKIVKTGWPMEYLVPGLAKWQDYPKKERILFPHRIAPEKQVEIFNDLAAAMPQYEWIVCQKHPLTKYEYHALLGESKMVFSANLQETLGIGCFEALCVGAIPLVPNRLSYKEMYSSMFSYNSEWTKDWTSYMKYKGELVNQIVGMMSLFPTPGMQNSIRGERRFIGREFFNASEMIKTIQNV